MTQHELIRLLDQLATAVTAADASDAGSVHRIASLLDRVAQAPGTQAALPLVQSCLQHCQSISTRAPEDARAELDTVCELVAELQDTLERAVAESSRALPAPDAALLREFVDGARSSLEEAEADILALERGSAEALGRFKRTIHTLKGESGVLGMDAIATVCHAIEDALQRPTNADHADRLLQACDWLRSTVTAIVTPQPVPPADAIVDLLRAAPGADALPAPAADPSASPTASTGAAEPPQIGGVERDDETVELFAEFLHESDDGLSRADQILMNVEGEADPESVNGLFRIFHTIKGVAAALEVSEVTKLAHATESLLNRVREGKLELRGRVVDLVFDATELMRAMMSMVRCAVEQGRGFSQTDGLDELIAALDEMAQGRVTISTAPPEPAKAPALLLGEILASPPIGLAPELIDQALASQKTTGRRLGEELVAQGSVRPKQVAQALRAQKEQREPAGARMQETIKVDLGRVDSLVEMIGELVIVETMVIHSPDVVGLSNPKIQNYLSQLTKITRDLQDVGMRMRMVPVRGVFQKMARMARDLARKGDKHVRLLTSGEGTEMDRSMVEQIADPLVHMIRNAIDHGLEMPAERQRAGKSAGGTVRLSAYHEGGSIIIEVADDGRGLDRDAILKKARANGLLGEGDKLSDADVHGLIFAPGFSTAEQVTELSGRGVGMDVVKRNVEKMRGRVHIQTRPGQGTTFKIALPLTLAIIDGMLVRCGSERYILPTLSIVESIQPDASMVLTMASHGELVNVRGEIIPLLRVDRLFGIRGAQADATQGLVVVVESLGRKVGLLVDEVVTQQQVVIKSLGAALSNVKFVSGAAILSDGTVGLILNLEELGSLIGLDAVARSRDRSSQRTLPQEGRATTVQGSRTYTGEQG